MKNTLKFGFCLMLFFLACSDPCDNIDCGANGTCVDGECQCDEGYSGVNCETNVCDAINCNNGDCDPVTGACTCDEGYEGEFCNTEIRAKYLGEYTGDASDCISTIIDALQIIDIEDLPEEFTAATAVVSADPSDINNIVIGSNNIALGDQNITMNPLDGTYVIPAMSTTIENEDLPFPITITTTGEVTFIDEDNFELSISIIVPLLPVIECTINMTKQ